MTTLPKQRVWIATWAALATFLFPSRPLAAELVSCSGGSLGDLYDRGFYVTSYPGITMDTASIIVSANQAGTYTLGLTARSGTFDGPLIGSASTSVALDGSIPDGATATFSFPTAPVTTGATVCFALTALGGSGGSVYFSIGGGCTNVIETEDTTPPLSTFRRNGVDLTITGGDTNQVLLTLTRNSNGIQLSWPRGALYQSASPSGGWSPVSGAAPPNFQVAPTAPAMFYRVKLN